MNFAELSINDSWTIIWQRLLNHFYWVERLLNVEKSIFSSSEALKMF